MHRGAEVIDTGDTPSGDAMFDAVVEIAEEGDMDDDLAEEGITADERDLLRLEKPGFLALAGRVLATLGDRVETGSWLAPTAVTVISAPPNLGEGVKRALNRLIQEPLRPIGGSLVLRMEDGGASKAARARFSARIRQALGWRDPVIIVLSGPTELEPSLAAALPPALPLAPLTAGILRDVLGILVPDDLPVAVLPDAADLAGFSEDELLMCLRAETVEAAAAAIAARVQRRDSRTGPGLEAIEGYGEAEAMARRLVADIGRWQRRDRLERDDPVRSLRGGSRHRQDLPRPRHRRLGRGALPRREPGRLAGLRTPWRHAAGNADDLCRRPLANSLDPLH